MLRLAALCAFAATTSAFMPGGVVKRSVLPRPHRGTVLSATEVPASAAAGAPGFQLPDLGKVFSGLKLELPKSLSMGSKRLVVVTGASSGLGRSCTRSLVERGDTFVVMACRDLEKAERVAQELNLDSDSYCTMYLDLAILDSVRAFAKKLRAFKGAKPLDVLVCNAAVYRPTDPDPLFTGDGYEMSMQVNHLGHLLLARLLLDDLKKAKDPRCIIVGSITGNTNTIGGGFVWPRADLGKLQGFERGIVGEGKGDGETAMADGKPFDGAKAYKDAKVCNMMTVSELHRRYHDSTGVTFASLYPGCIATTSLFREKREWFRVWFPWFQKYVTGGFVSEEEAGDRLAQVVTDPQCTKSDVYWSWNGNAQQLGVKLDEEGRPTGAGGSGGEIFENQVSDAVADRAIAAKMYELSCKAVGIDA